MNVPEGKLSCEIVERLRDRPHIFPDDNSRTFSALLENNLRHLSDAGYKTVSDENEIRSIVFTKYKDIIFDLDGVLLMGYKPMHNVSNAVRTLRRQGKRIFFVTNSSAQDRQMAVDKLRGAGVEAYKEEVYCASYVTALNILREFPDVKKVFVVGERGLKTELREVGLEVVDDENHPVEINSEAAFERTLRDLHEDVGAVVIGWDRKLNYHKLSLATLYLQLHEEKEAGRVPYFLACNMDEYDILSGKKIPANGATLSFLKSIVGRDFHCCGKPSSFLAELLTHKVFSRETTCVFGDRVDSDVALAKKAGFDSILVLSGAATSSELLKMAPEDPWRPDYVFPHVGLLADVE